MPILTAVAPHASPTARLLSRPDSAAPSARGSHSRTPSRMPTAGPQRTGPTAGPHRTGLTAGPHRAGPARDYEPVPRSRT